MRVRACVSVSVGVVQPRASWHESSPSRAPGAQGLLTTTTTTTTTTNNNNNNNDNSAPLMWPPQMACPASFAASMMPLISLVPAQQRPAGQGSVRSLGITPCAATQRTRLRPAAAPRT
jgi:hypothetical protein